MAVAAVSEAFLKYSPPPSDLGECDNANSGLYASSPIVSGFSYPSPAPSDPVHSSDKIRLHHASFVEMNELLVSPSDPDIHSPDTYINCTSNLPITLPALIDLPQHNMATAYPSATDQHHLFDAGQWFQYSQYSSTVPSSFAYDATMGHSSTYEHLNTSNMPMDLSTSIIPPTPQEIAPMTFDFSSPPTLHNSSQHHSMSHFNTPDQYSTHSQRSSISSLSRSCSPGSQTYMIPSIPSSSASAILNPLQASNPGSYNGSRRLSSRANSVSSTTSLHAYGIPVPTAKANLQHDSSLPSSTSHQAWRCAYPGCTSRAIFTRGCDLRKHYNRHSKHLFCRVDGCPQSEVAARSAAAASSCGDGTLAGGFSSKKDRARHEAKHNPGVRCEWTGPNGEECGRIFSRVDNMKDHVRRIHRKADQHAQSGGLHSKP